jgi:hypothetical protein
MKLKSCLGVSFHVSYRLSTGCPWLFSRSAAVIMDQVDALDNAPFFSRQVFARIFGPYRRSLDDVLGTLV